MKIGRKILLGGAIATWVYVVGKKVFEAGRIAGLIQVYAVVQRDYKSKNRRSVGYGDGYKSYKSSYEEYIFNTRKEAEDVLSALIDIVKIYNRASVADLKDLIGLVSAYKDDKIGWTDLREASVIRIRAGYYLMLPKPKTLAVPI